MSRLTLPLLLSVLALSGCGGGGGASTSSLVYRTDWTDAALPGVVTGDSQKVSLYNSAGELVDAKILNTNGGSQSVTFRSLSSADYLLSVELYDGGDASGTVTGTVNEIVNPARKGSVATAVGSTPQSVLVTPTTRTLTVPQAARFYAAAVDGNGSAVITKATDFAWTATAGLATVDSTGLLSSLKAGVGVVQARYTPTNLTGSASLTVNGDSPRKGKWTILVYMNAANDLSAYDTLNINQMEQVANNEDVRFVVQWKQVYDASFDLHPEFIGTRRYLVKPDDTDAIQSQLIQDLGNGVDMGSPDTLQAFLQWGKTYYPADRYAVVIWNHGNGWRRSVIDEPATRGVSYDDETGHHIDTWDLQSALAGTKWDIVSWDASLMQMMEVAYQIKGQASYVVGSEESPPGQGLPYNLVFKPFQDSPNSSTTDLSNAFVTGMLAVPSYASAKITQSVIDTSKLDNLRDALTGLANALIANKTELATAIPIVRLAAQGYSVTTTRKYYDIVDLCDKIDLKTTNPSVLAATQAVRAAIAQAVVYEGHNANSPGSHGLSIDFSDASTFNAGGATYYGNLTFANDSTWESWLKVAP